MQPIPEFFPLLQTPKRVVVTMHQKPDGDAMGSALGMYHFLTALGHDVQVLSPTNWASFLNWMPGCKNVIDYEGMREKAMQALQNVDLLVCLDFNVMHRTKNLAPHLEKLQCVKVLIDHHEQPAVDQFSFGISETKKSSTCEMVFDFIVASGHADKIDKNIAQCLYTGIMTDTGSFRFPAAGSSVHAAVAELKKTGFDHTLVHQEVYDNFLESRLRFIGYVLSKKLQVIYEYNTAIISVTKAELLRFDITTGDTEGLVNYPLSIQGIRFAAIVIDRDEERKWSFRSKGKFDVNTFARTHFEGGGHYNAAGGRSAESIEATLDKFLKILPTYEAQLNENETN
jgi:bifunctional oligoribonuclease and PAP phosphatase NrnA